MAPEQPDKTASLKVCPFSDDTTRRGAVVSAELWEHELVDLLGRLDRRRKRKLYAELARELDGRRYDEIKKADRAQLSLPFPEYRPTLSLPWPHNSKVGEHCRWPHEDCRWGPRAQPAKPKGEGVTTYLRQVEARLAQGVLKGAWPEMTRKRLARGKKKPLDKADSSGRECA